MTSMNVLGGAEHEHRGQDDGDVHRPGDDRQRQHRQDGGQGDIDPDARCGRRSCRSAINPACRPNSSHGTRWRNAAAATSNGSVGLRGDEQAGPATGHSVADVGDPRRARATTGSSRQARRGTGGDRVAARRYKRTSAGTPGGFRRQLSACRCYEGTQVPSGSLRQPRAASLPPSTWIVVPVT